MRCPQCGTETPDAEWNCVNCRINVYWASQHYGELAKIRERQGLAPGAATPSFLVRVHHSAMEERVAHGGLEEHKVRRIARSVMQGVSQSGTPEAEPSDPDLDARDEPSR